MFAQKSFKENINKWSTSSNLICYQQNCEFFFWVLEAKIESLIMFANRQQDWIVSTPPNHVLDLTRRISVFVALMKYLGKSESNRYANEDTYYCNYLDIKVYFHFIAKAISTRCSKNCKISKHKNQNYILK